MVGAEGVGGGVVVVGLGVWIGHTGSSSAKFRGMTYSSLASEKHNKMGNNNVRHQQLNNLITNRAIRNISITDLVF